jgi:sigma-E factor negative regulatory protein RseA
MTERPPRQDHAAQAERLSALIDGELPSDEVAAACRAWRDDADCRSRWHAHHLIGDVLRSPDLAARPAADEAFLQRLRVRLADEPALLAPAPWVAGGGEPAVPDLPVLRPPVRRSALRRWAAPAGIAAGMALVVGTLTAVRPGVDPLSAAPALARVAPAASETELVRVANGAMIRDARLDRYLAAHKQFHGSTALGPSSGFLRSATHEASAR